MDGHFLGKRAVSGKSSAAGGSSLAVRQFVDLAFGWMPVHRPSTPFKVEAVKADERYCLGCFGVRWFDVVCGAGREAAFCRACGTEFGKDGENG